MSEQNPQAAMPEHQTGYTTGTLKLVKRGGFVSYFTALKINGLIYSGPANWVGTLHLDNPWEMHQEIHIRTLEASVSLLEYQRDARTKGVFMEQAGVGSLCIVDEEFFLSYDAEIPKGWGNC